jgi:hypothetical protein
MYSWLFDEIDSLAVLVVGMAKNSSQQSAALQKILERLPDSVCEK